MKIKDGEYWEIGLHEDQRYLGRCVIWCKRDGDIDFLDMNDDEKEEFWDLSTRLKEALMKSFEPDRMNYAALANVTYHLHIHVIPRYKDKRVLEDTDFIDDRWGQNYSPSNRFKVGDDVLVKIRDKIKENWVEKV